MSITCLVEVVRYSAVDTDVLQPNAIDAVDLNNVAIGVGAESWLRYRDFKVGSLNKIRMAGTGELRWASSRTRGAGHRLRRIYVDGQQYTILHDALGRATLTLDFELTYDAANRLTEAYNPTTGAFEYYAYDGQGRLAYVYNSEENAAQHFGYDGPRMVVATDETYALLWQSFQGPSLDMILEFHDANQAVIPLIDHRKSIAGAWDMADGFMVGVATYDAEGRVAQYSNDEALECNEVGNPGVNCNAPAGLPFGLNARWRSPLTGFVNMHHRWYSPRMGEFLSHDPLGYIDSYNLFGFATYDPINGYDPFGLRQTGLVPTPPVGNVVKKRKRVSQGSISKKYDEFVEKMNDEDASIPDRIEAAAYRGLYSHHRNMEDMLTRLLNAKEDISRAAQTAGAKTAQAIIHHENGDDLSAVGSAAEAIEKGIDAFDRTLSLLPRGKIRNKRLPKINKKPPKFGAFKDHAKRHGKKAGMSEKEYMKSAISHTRKNGAEWSKKFRHNGQTKLAHVSKIPGTDKYILSSSNISGNRIFTHMPEGVTKRYLENSGITLPKGM